MNEKNLKVKVTSGILAGLLVVSVGVVSYASNNQGFKGINGFKNKPQATQQNVRMNQKVDFSTKLAELVTAGSITQAQSDKIVAFMASEQATKKSDQDKLKEMTDAERKTYLEANKPEKATPLASLVTDGTLTQEQADLVGKAIMPGGKGDMGGRGGFEGQKQMNFTQPKLTEEEMQAKMAEQVAKQEAELANIVTAGTITQEQADKVVIAMDAEKAAKVAEQEKISAMTDAERKAYFEANKTEKVMPLASLVTDGTLTQEQADTILKSIMKDNGFGRNGGGHGMGHNGEFKVPNASTNAVVQ